MAMSFMEGKGLSTTQLLNLVVNTLYDQFVEKDIKGFDGFNVGILDAFNTINMALPGKHYVAPSFKDVKDLFEQWKEMDAEEKRKKKFTEFIDENVNLNKVDESMLITAIVAPSAAMMAKKTGHIVPQLALMNAIPDVVFVPSATLLALFAIKIIRLTFVGKTTSKDTVSSATEIEEPQTTIAPETSKEPQIETEQEPQIETEQEPQTPATPETEIEKSQIETEQEPQATTTPEILKEEPQIETEQEPQTTTTPEILKQEPQIETEEEPQSPTPPETEIEKEPQIETGQEPQTTTTPEIEEKPQSEPPSTSTLEKEPPKSSIEGPQVATVQKPHIITGHVHKDNIPCFLCEELEARKKEENKE